MAKTEKLIYPVEVVKHEIYPDMYRLRYEDGVISKNFYNLTRANDILRNFADYCYKRDATPLLKARKLGSRKAAG